VVLVGLKPHLDDQLVSFIALTLWFGHLACKNRPQNDLLCVYSLHTYSLTLCRAWLVLGWVTVSGVQLPVRENLSQYITGLPSQLSQAIPLWGGTSTSQRAVTLSG